MRLTARMAARMSRALARSPLAIGEGVCVEDLVRTIASAGEAEVLRGAWRGSCGGGCSGSAVASSSGGASNGSSGWRRLGVSGVYDDR
jgi:hypothetical protein